MWDNVRQYDIRFHNCLWSSIHVMTALILYYIIWSNLESYSCQWILVTPLKFRDTFTSKYIKCIVVLTTYSVPSLTSQGGLKILEKNWHILYTTPHLTMLTCIANKTHNWSLWWGGGVKEIKQPLIGGW